MTYEVTQFEAVERLGIVQARVSDLVRGRWDKVSLEMFIALEARLRRKVRVEFVA
ncbi:MAG: helix-turn-helix domain-containing protein [Nitrospiraceae bacterium]